MNAFGRQRDWHARRDVLRAGLRRLAPDVVTLQEVFTAGDSDEVVDLLGPGYRVFHQRGRDTNGGGASIASRWPFDVISETDLQTDERLYNSGWIGSLALIRVAAPEPIGPLLIAHHKPTWQSGAERERELQAVAAARVIERVLEKTDMPVVLAGDFDATPDSASIRFWTGRQSLDGMSVYYQDAWEALHPDDPGHTFVPENPLRSAAWKPRPGRRIDYVMVRCGDKGAPLDVINCERVFDRPIDGVWASDHFGVMADLSLSADVNVSSGRR